MDETATVLFVDDEQNILNTMKRIFMEDDTQILTNTSGQGALELLKNNSVNVIVSDNLMPGMNGIEFLTKAKALAPDAVRIMLTGYADIKAAIDAINMGEVYKFINKPWDDDELRNVIFEAITRYRVVQSLKKKRLICIILHRADNRTEGLVHERSLQKGSKKYALVIADVLGLENVFKESIRQGSWLHDCGKIGVPEVILNFDGRPTPEQFDIINKGIISILGLFLAP